MRRYAIVFGIACAVCGIAVPAHAADIAPRLVNVIETFDWSPPSPDPMGLAYDSETKSLLVTDSEVDEMGIFAGVNFWETATDGTVRATHDLTGFTIEPADVAYDHMSRRHFFVDDDSDKVFEVDPARMSEPIRSFSTRSFTGDPEGLSYGAGSLFLAAGLGDSEPTRKQSIFRIQPGPDGIFNGEAPTGDDVVTRFSTVPLGQNDPEDVAYDHGSRTLFIVSRDSKIVSETTLDGVLVNSYDLSASAIRKPAGVVVAPSSDDPMHRSLYVADRNVDNNSDPSENDGAIYEYEIGPADANRSPAVTNPGDQRSVEGEDVTLPIEASDPDGDPVTFRASGLPPGLSINRSSGVISGTIEPGASAESPYSTEVTVTDGTASDLASFQWDVSDGSSPEPPQGLSLSPITTGVLAMWEDGGSGIDIASYLVYRGSEEAGPYEKLTAAPIRETSFLDREAPLHATSWYRVTAIDRGGNESPPAVGSVYRGPIRIVGVSAARSKGMTMTIGTPAGTAAGDVLLAAITGRGYAGVSAPAGWTLLRDTVAGSSLHLKQIIFVRVATAGEPGSHVFQMTGRGAAVGVLVAYRGAVAPAAVSAGQASGLSQQISAPAVVSASSDAVVVGFFGIAAETSVSTAEGMVERFETSMPSGLLRVTLEVADDIVSAGALGTRDALAAHPGTNIGQVVILRPAESGESAESASVARASSGGFAATASDGGSARAGDGPLDIRPAAWFAPEWGLPRVWFRAG